MGQNGIKILIGQDGGRVVNGDFTTDANKPVRLIHFLENTTLANLRGNIDGTATNFTYPSGSELHGIFTRVNVSAGRCVVYY